MNNLKVLSSHLNWGARLYSYSGLRQAGICQAPLSHLPVSTNHGRWLTGAWPITACRKPEQLGPGKSSSVISPFSVSHLLELQSWEECGGRFLNWLTGYLIDPGLSALFMFFLTGASMRIVQLDTREWVYKQDKKLCLGHNDQCLPAHNRPQHVSGNSSLKCTSVSYRICKIL